LISSRRRSLGRRGDTGLHEKSAWMLRSLLK
jgi:hypothetical protein